MAILNAVQPKSTWETFFYERFFNTRTGFVISNSKFFDILRTSLSFTKAIELKYAFCVTESKTKVIEANHWTFTLLLEASLASLNLHNFVVKSMLCCTGTLNLDGPHANLQFLILITEPSQNQKSQKWSGLDYCCKASRGWLVPAEPGQAEGRFPCTCTLRGWFTIQLRAPSALSEKRQKYLVLFRYLCVVYVLWPKMRPIDVVDVKDQVL